LGPCPCGKGHFVKTVTSWDNPWSAADIGYELRCAPCAAAWRTNGPSITLVSSEAEYNKAWGVRGTAFKAAMKAADAVVADYFKTFAAPSKKAQHAELTNLNITSLSYRQFLEAVKGGKPLSLGTTPLTNQTWLMGEAKKQGRDQQLKSLLGTLQAAQSACDAASKKIVKQRFE
jgi:hypothetical protein